MAVVEQRTVRGIVRATWDDATEQYREFAADGTTVTLTRAYTPVELAAKQEREERSTAQSNAALYRQQIAAGIAALQTDVATLQGVPGIADSAINANPATYVKALAAITLRLTNSVIGLARIVSGSLN